MREVAAVGEAGEVRRVPEVRQLPEVDRRPEVRQRQAMWRRPEIRQRQEMRQRQLPQVPREAEALVAEAVANAAAEALATRRH